MINNKVFYAPLLCLVLASCSPQPEWILSGSISGMDRNEWHSASESKKLGTAGYWLLSLERKNWLNDPSLIEGDSFKQASIELKNCIDNHLTFSEKPTNAIVADCVYKKGWQNKNKNN